MTIRYKDRQIIDYAIFATKAPYDDVEAVKSSDTLTDNSGSVPATMTITLADGLTIQTQKFVAMSLCHNEFRILDRAIYETISKIMEAGRHYGELQDVLLTHYCNYDCDWSIAVFYDDVMEDYDNSVECFDVEHVVWSVENNAGA